VITQAWLDSWEYVTPLLAFPPEVRRVIETTNAIEALHRQLLKAVKTKGHFPSEDAALKLLYLAILNAVPAWTRTRKWTAALLAFKIQFGDRLPDSPSTTPTQTRRRPRSGGCGDAAGERRRFPLGSDR
jgi:putative transposase